MLTGNSSGMLGVPPSPSFPRPRKDILKSVTGEDKAQRVIREFGVAMSLRGIFEGHWQQIAERIWTGMSWKFNPYWYSSPGQQKTEYVFDSTAAMALNRFGAILDSLLTPRNSTWHGMQASDSRMNKKREVRLWFEEVRDILFHYRYLPQANFASQNQQNYKGVGAFGTGCLFIDPLSQMKGLRYKAISLGEVYFVENHQGIIDKAFRHFELTARQAIQKWGNEAPDQAFSYMETSPETAMQFIHEVRPNEERDPDRKDFRGMKFESTYVSKQDAKVMEEGGYNVFPYAISRYEQYPGEVYGRSVAMDLLPAIKTLNEEKKTMLKQGHRSTDPVLLSHDDGVLDGFSMKPGVLNAGGVTADGKLLVHALPTGNVQAGKEMMDDERTLINDGFLVSLFQILTESPQMTATEVLERTREKGILLAPTVGRQQSEYLGPMIDREIDILARQGLLPPMPASLKEAQGEYKITYDSPLSRAQRAEEASGVMRTVQSVIEVVQATQDPKPLFYFNWDKIVPAMADIQGVPLHWMNDQATVLQLSQAHQKMMQQQQQAQAMPGQAAMINAGAKAHTALKGQ
jgi:hypothetical protein